MRLIQKISTDKEPYGIVTAESGCFHSSTVNGLGELTWRVTRFVFPCFIITRTKQYTTKAFQCSPVPFLHPYSNCLTLMLQLTSFPQPPPQATSACNIYMLLGLLPEHSRIFQNELPTPALRRQLSWFTAHAAQVHTLTCNLM